jgi:hypothetical protein
MPATNAFIDFAQLASRATTSSDSAVQTKHLLARDLRLETLLDSSAAAQTEGDRQLALRKTDGWGQVHIMQLAGKQGQFRVGQTIILKVSRWDMASGRNMIIRKVVEDSQTGITQIEAIG